MTAGEHRKTCARVELELDDLDSEFPDWPNETTSVLENCQVASCQARVPAIIGQLLQRVSASGGIGEGARYQVCNTSILKPNSASTHESAAQPSGHLRCGGHKPTWSGVPST